jgi:signal transduction histidine kinase/CheY-like chemotaxis protein
MFSGFALFEVILDPHGNPVDYRLLHANSELERMTGQKREEWIGRTSSHLAFLWPKEEAEACFGVAMGGMPRHWERYNDTLQRYFEGRAFSPLPGQFALLLHDITDRKRIEAELEKHRGHLEQLVVARTQELDLTISHLERAKGAAEAANKAKSVFLASMSHELRTPLNAVLGFSQLMAREAGRSPRDLDRLEKIRQAGSHLLALINDVLSITRIETHKLSLNASPFDLRACLEGIEGMIRVKAEAKRLDFEVELDPRVPVGVEGDEGKLRQVLLNLLGNAVKFTRQGRVGLCVRALGQNRVHFQVSDTGPGISAEELPQLFGAFVQAEAGRRSVEGSGLGLNLSRALVRLMGGEISVESEPGRGSAFSFEIPLETTERLPAPSPDRWRLRRVEGQAPLKQLVADDQADNRELLSEYLEMAGFPVQSVANGVEAVEAWRSWQPGIIWMDMRMPELDGYEATRRIRALEVSLGRPRTVILAITASAFDQDREAILAAGCDAIVHKPFREADLVQALAQFGGVAFREEGGHGVPQRPAPPSLDGLDPAWCEAFRARLRAGEMQEIRRLADQLPADRESLADYLRQAIQSFRLDELEALFDPRRNP